MKNERFVVFYMGTLVVFNTNLLFIKQKNFLHIFTSKFNLLKVKYLLVKFIALAVNFSKFELNLEEKW